MSNPSTNASDPITPFLLTLRIIWGALLFAPLMFLGIVVGVMRSGKILAADPWTVTIPFGVLALAMSAGCLLLSAFLPGVLVTNGRKALASGKPMSSGRTQGLPDGDFGGLLALYNTKTIVALALVEGATFFDVIAFMLEGKAIVLAAVVLLVAVQATRFPTRTGLESWLDDQHAQLQAERGSIG